MHQVEQLARQIIAIVIAPGIQTEKQNICIPTSGLLISFENVGARDGTSGSLIEEVKGEGEEGNCDRNRRHYFPQVHGGNLTD